MPLADTADRRVTTHRPERIEVMGEQQRLCTHARAGQRRLSAGMATADDDHVKTVRKQHLGKYGIREG